jgi:hypothetical protein
MIQLLQFQMQPLLLQLQDKFFPTHQSTLQSSVKDRSSHGKVTKGKWTTKREKQFTYQPSPTDPESAYAHSFLKIGDIDVNG